MAKKIRRRAVDLPVVEVEHLRGEEETCPHCGIQMATGVQHPLRAPGVYICVLTHAPYSPECSYAAGLKTQMEEKMGNQIDEIEEVLKAGKDPGVEIEPDGTIMAVAPTCSSCHYSKEREGERKLKCGFKLPGRDEAPHWHDLVEPDFCCDLHPDIVRVGVPHGQKDTAFIQGLGTVRQCTDCGCLVAGGPTRCGRCAEKKS